MTAACPTPRLHPKPARPRPASQTASGCAATSWRFAPDGYLRAILTARVYDVAVVTPLDKAVKLSDAVGSNVLLKREDLQPVFSFKLRGAYNKMAKLTQEQLDRGVITSSAGNHAQGVALSAQKLVRARALRDARGAGALGRWGGWGGAMHVLRPCLLAGAVAAASCWQRRRLP